MRILTVANQKGGAGKTITAMALAALAADRGSRVLLVDAEVDGGAAWWAERVGERRPFDYAEAANPVNLRAATGYDLVVVDTPGREAGMATTRVALEQSDLALLPTPPEGQSLRKLLASYRAAQELGVPTLSLLTMVDGRTPVDEQWARGYLEGAGIDVCAQSIRRYVTHSRAANQRQLVTDLSGNALEDYRLVVDEVLNALERGQS